MAGDATFPHYENMTDRDGNEIGYQDTGVRRRHSAQHEPVNPDVIPVASVAATQHEQEILGPVRRSATEPIRPASSTGSDIPVSNARKSTSTEHPKVRFSLDATGPATIKTKKRKSDELAQDEYGATARLGTPNLSVDTRAAAAAAAASMASFHAPKRAAPSSRDAQPVMSPKTRNRGYSLRTSLFQRNMRPTPVDHSDSVIEMTGVGSSNQDFHRVYTAYSQDGTSQSGKKSMDTVVEVSPIHADYQHYDDEPKSQYTGLRGSAALPNYQSWIQQRARRHPAWRSATAAYSRARDFVLRINHIPPSKDGRHIDLDPSRKTAPLDERTGKAYVPNTIRSSRYNAWNFVPRQLFAQFSKLANFYFLCVSILQMIPGLSTTGSYTTIVPLLFFVCISMGKEGYDDLRRYKLDKEENNRETSVLHAYRPTPGSGDLEEGTHSTDGHEGLVHWAKTKWQNVQVGDVIKLQRDEAAPADIVLLNSTGANGVAYIETMALDGETNLKSKQTTQSLSKLCDSPELIASCNAHFVVEDPNLDLYNFEGRVLADGQTAPLTNHEIVYRGSILRNTPEATGMVIYTGEECKIRMNANKNPRIKAPALQAVVNKVVIVIVIFVIALAIFNTVAYQVWRSGTETKSWYLTDARVAFFPVLTSFIIMFNTMIPLSLYVSMEIVKLAQMFLMNDIDMYDEETNTPFEARTSTINEELGQISYIFSDKTGTLTDNSMKFRKISVAGTAWLHDVDLQGQDDTEDLLMHKKRTRKGKGKKPIRNTRVSTTSQLGASEGMEDGRKSTSQWQSSARPAKAQHELNTRQLIRYLQRKPYTNFAKKARMLLLSMALCHTCLPEVQKDGQIDFQASSPDELALVRAAQELGYLVADRAAGTLTVKTFPAGQDKAPVLETYEILDVIEFSSKRKRMSVLVRFPDQRIAVICKGADSIVMQRLRLASLANQKAVEIEMRSSKRKSLEAQEALRRQSEHHERASFSRPSFSRPSMSLPHHRPSMGGLGRVSIGNSKLLNVRNEVDSWLNERERDVDTTFDEDVSAHYSPRPSTHMPGRQSLAASEARMSFQGDDDEDDELVEEALVTDEAAVIERCFQHVNDFATEGLRTLLYGHRFLEEQDYLGWKKIYHDATTSLVNRQEMIEAAGELIEQDLELGGATAIEDKLQKGVPEAIEKLRRANIKMWMLTGDKRETAINIGHSCRLIKDYSAVTVLDHETGQVEQRIAATILDINNKVVAHSVVVVDGQTLAMIEMDEAIRNLFYELAVLADSVICCRASPSQKAGLVKAVRRTVKGSITLAIGDGANDIAMIQEAHVGIGITGKEGLQAARTSDYSIAQFRFLVKLLVVHGRYNYSRICKYTVATFWKEFLFYLTQALYQRWTGYTGTSLYESWSLSMFNTLFTSLPVIFLGVFEKDLLPQTLIAVPELYTKGQRNEGFNFKVYLGWMFMASSEAMLVYFLMISLYGYAPFATDQSIYALGSLCFTSCIIIIGLKLQLLEIHNVTVTAAIALLASIGGWFLWMVILAGLYHNNNEYGVKDGFYHRFGDSGLWWLTLILIVACLIALEYGLRSLKSAYLPTDVDTFQALERDIEVRKRFEESAASFLQAGWNHGSKKSSIELLREEELQAQRELEVQELLDRPRTMDRPGTRAIVQVQTEEEAVLVQDGRRSTDIQDMLSTRFGPLRQGTLLGKP